MKPNVIIIHPEDNVAVALEDIAEGGEIRLPDGDRLVARSAVAFSHKVLLSDLGAGGDIIKYGEVIARTAVDLKQGDWVHVHNLNLDEE